MKKIHKITLFVLMLWQVIGIILLTNGLLYNHIFSMLMGIATGIVGCVLSITYVYSKKLAE